MIRNSLFYFELALVLLKKAPQRRESDNCDPIFALVGTTIGALAKLPVAVTRVENVML
jgi:hypothetical protein